MEIKNQVAEEQKMTPEEMRHDIIDKLHYNRVFVTHVAKELNRNRGTIYLWLNNMTDKRYKDLNKAIDKIIAEL